MSDSRDWANRFRPSSADTVDDKRRTVENSAQTSVRRLPTLIAAIIISLVLSAAVIWISGVNALFDGNAPSAGTLLPTDPRTVFARAENEAQVTGRVSDRTRRDTARAFAKTPLAEEPLLIGAVDAAARGNGRLAATLTELAHRRNPRSRYATLLLLQQSLAGGHARKATAEMALLARLLPQASSLLTSQLALMAATPAMADTVRDVVQTDPRLRTDLLERLAQQDTAPALLFRLAGPITPATGAAVPHWQRLLLDRLVARGQIAEARQVWAQITGPSATRTGAIYDPEFAGLPGPPPFSWEVQASGEGFAELGRNAHELQVDYLGNEPARLASQLITLAPGHYRLSFVVEGAIVAESGAIGWTITCHPSGNEIGQVSIAGQGMAPRTVSDEFTVPAGGCPAQWLRLVGSRAEFAKEQQATIRQMRITGGDQP